MKDKRLLTVGLCTLVTLGLLGTFPVSAQLIIEIGGPYLGNECTELWFDATGSYDTNMNPVQFRWDFEDDGVFNTDWSSSPYAFHTWLDNFIGNVRLEMSNGSAVVTDTAAVRIDNVDPIIDGISGPVDPIEVGSEAVLVVSLHDGDDRTGVMSLDCLEAVFSWDDGTQTTYELPAGSLSVTGSHVYSAAGLYTVLVEITDDDGGYTSGTYQLYIVVYEPNPLPGNGFVTGGGWILSAPGAYKPDPSLTGQANFGFVAKYHKGAQIPDGNTEFNFHVADLNFHSMDYEWLIVTGGDHARYKGNGTINGEGDYGFMLTGVDNGNSGDQFRIKIWDKATGDMIYDNNMDQLIDGGQIVVHSK